jgi:hypothetical protein
VIETVGAQEYHLDPADLVTRMHDWYGPAAAEDLAGRLDVPYLV